MLSPTLEGRAGLEQAEIPEAFVLEPAKDVDMQVDGFIVGRDHSVTFDNPNAVLLIYSVMFHPILYAHST